MSKHLESPPSEAFQQATPWRHESYAPYKDHLSRMYTCADSGSTHPAAS
uniref:Uncharacterized protein n=1 Tax=Arundo donax TaxID=35708 RepID=A0A0A9SJ65_ARUDO